MCLVATTLSNPFEGCLVDVSGLMPAVFALIPAAGLAVHSRADGRQSERGCASWRPEEPRQMRSAL